MISHFSSVCVWNGEHTLLKKSKVRPGIVDGTFGEGNPKNILK